jgi:hypothetical protein
VATSYVEVLILSIDSCPSHYAGCKIARYERLESIGSLRSDFNYLHIPIHLISGEENRNLALKRGARSFYLKPLDNATLDKLLRISYSSAPKNPGGYLSSKTMKLIRPK